MKKTLLERIANLRKMIQRVENLSEIKNEIHNIFEMLRNEQDREIKNKALSELLLLSFDMSNILKNLEFEEETKIIPVEVNIDEYLDAIVIRIDKKTPYSKLMDIIHESVPNFEKRKFELDCADFQKKEKMLLLEYKNRKYKSIVLNFEKWNLSEESLLIYSEGLVEYILK